MTRSSKPEQGLAVVKLGGSLMASPHLRMVLDAICAPSAPAVIVPGGGPFADTVRGAQKRLGFNDRAAHRMALLAMAQFAEVLAGLEPRLRVASGLSAIRGVVAQGAVPVWSPWPVADGLELLPESWNLTSDSLAAWLAASLGAERLILLKHRDPPDCPMRFRQVADAGIVDALFPAFAAAFLEGSPPSPGSAKASPPSPARGEGNLSMITGTSSQLALLSPLPLRERVDAAKRRPGEGGCASVWWLGPAQFAALTAILDGRMQVGMRLHADLPEHLPV